MKKGNLIILNASSSCGKSSTCRALQDLFDERYILLGLDVFSQATPPKQNNMLTIEPSYFTAMPYVKNGLSYFHISTGPLLDEVIFTSFKSIAVFLENGINVVSDQLFWSPQWFRRALDVLIPYHVFLVGMHVSDEEGTRRELLRSGEHSEDIIANGRPGGWNRTSEEIIHKNMLYDFEIDNTNLSVEETAKRIKQAYENMPDPLAFKALYKTYCP